MVSLGANRLGLKREWQTWGSECFASRNRGITDTGETVQHRVSPPPPRDIQVLLLLFCETRGDLQPV